MAGNQKISQLTPVEELSSDAIIPIVQDSKNYIVTVEKLAYASVDSIESLTEEDIIDACPA